MNDVSDVPRDSASVQTSAGELVLFAQRFEDIGAFSKLSPDESPSRRLRSYLPRIASKASQIREGVARVALDEATCAQLSDDDIERIAETYLTLPTVRKIAEDQKARSDPMERAGAELSTTYLDRLLRVEHDRQMEDPAKTYAAFSERFGGPLTNALLDVDRQATSLKEAAASFITEHDAAAQARWAEHQASIHLASAVDPLAALGDRGSTSLSGIDARIGAALDPAAQRSDRDAMVELTRSIGWITAQSAHLLSGLSDSATQFLRQFAEAAEASEARTRRLLRVAVTMIVIACLLSAAACALIALAVRDRWEQERVTAQWQESLAQSLKSNAAAQDKRLTAIEAGVRDINGRQQAEVNAPLPVPDAAVRGDKEASAAAKHDSVKSAPAARQTKRKPTR